jgi:UDP-N-acetylmuramoyl-tripeptide--D-alanyl-D-alanine ligase
MKKIAKSLVVYVLGKQVKSLVRKNQPKVIAIAGSMGKTSTKLAAAQYLKQHFRVQTQTGNYNDVLTVPLVFFGHSSPPSLTNPLAWLKIFANNQRQLKKPYPYDIVVVELGTDGPGQIVEFRKYLSPDIAVITAIAPEHMEFFGGIDAVAREELSVMSFSKQTLANSDLCVPHISGNKAIKRYGRDSGDYCLSDIQFDGMEYSFGLHIKSHEPIKATYKTVSETQLYGVLASVALGDMLGFPTEKIQAAVESIQASPGRMRVLDGAQNSTILDDTYNASPDATIASLRTLFQLEAAQRIALLGNMNELGAYSKRAHTEVGEFCDPKKVDLVITLGTDANTYTAAAAKAKGCEVITTASPYEAASVIHSHLKPGAVILAKGSQNGVFAEEAVKQLLANAADAKQLVRQSPQWLTKKAEQFPLPKGAL